MRLTEDQSQIYFEHSKCGINVLKDMSTLFTERPSFRDKTLRAFGGNVIAMILDGIEPTTIVDIKKLDEHLYSARWTAVQAYRVRHGLDFDTLVTEVPGLRGYQEWQNLRSAEKRNRATLIYQEFAEKREALITDRNITDDQFEQEIDRLTEEENQSISEIYNINTNDLDFYVSTSEGSGNDQASRFFNGLLGDIDTRDRLTGELEIAIAQGDESGIRFNDEMYSRHIESTSDLYKLPEELLHTHTNFFAKASSLPDAAHILSRNYGNLLFHADDPDSAVAEALGAVSLSQIDLLWEDAMREKSPLKAAQFILQMLGK